MLSISRAREAAQESTPEERPASDWDRKYRKYRNN
jgi:hypothetical protein